jgi:hypothetical protein
MPAPSAPSSTDAQRNARYAYLIGRLRNRQITMEEATELFGIMQGMLRTSELARQAALRLPAPPPSRVPEAPPPVEGRPPLVPVTDDLFLAGLLAMGAGAGLLAALSKRTVDSSSSSSSTGPGRRTGDSSSA